MNKELKIKDLIDDSWLFCGAENYGTHINVTHVQDNKISDLYCLHCGKKATDIVHHDGYYHHGYNAVCNDHTNKDFGFMCVKEMVEYKKDHSVWFSYSVQWETQEGHGNSSDGDCTSAMLREEHIQSVINNIKEKGHKVLSFRRFIRKTRQVEPQECSNSQIGACYEWSNECTGYPCYQ